MIASTVAATVSTKPVKLVDYMPFYAPKKQKRRTSINLAAMFGDNVY